MRDVGGEERERGLCMMNGARRERVNESIKARARLCVSGDCYRVRRRCAVCTWSSAATYMCVWMYVCMCVYMYVLVCGVYVLYQTLKSETKQPVTTSSGDSGGEGGEGRRRGAAEGLCR